MEKTHASLDDATSASEHASQQIAKTVESFQIEPRHFAADNLQVALRYTNDNREISAYVVTRRYMIVVNDLKRLEPLVSALLKNGANQLEGVQFRSTELRKHRDKARSMAIRAAKEKAEALAAELGCTVGRPITIGESGGGMLGSSRGVSLYNNAVHIQNTFQESPDPAGDENQTLPLGQIAIQATINATFDLVPPGEN